MANRDPSVFADPDTVVIDRKHNRHASFGLGLHRCIGSNWPSAVYKTMLGAVLDRMPDYRCDPAGAVHYDTVGIINGMKHLPAMFTPGAGSGSAWKTRSSTGRRSSTSSAWPNRSHGCHNRSRRSPECQALRRFDSSGIDRLRLTGYGALSSCAIAEASESLVAPRHRPTVPSPPVNPWWLTKSVLESRPEILNSVEIR